MVHDNLADMADVLRGLQYQKGAWILHMLRWEVGTEIFRTGLREYYRRYRDSTASTADFVRLMEELSGMELDWFFQQWLHRTPSPALEGSWRYYPASGVVEMELTQTQPGPPYRLHLEVAVTGPGNQETRTEVIQMTEMEQRFRIAVEGEPEAVSLDPDTWALIRADFRKGN